MRRQVEGHTQALLAGLDVGLVERVTLLDGRKSGVLKEPFIFKHNLFHWIKNVLCGVSYYQIRDIMNCKVFVNISLLIKSILLQ
jgi:hypothetical protein